MNPDLEEILKKALIILLTLLTAICGIVIGYMIVTFS